MPHHDIIDQLIVDTFENRAGELDIINKATNGFMQFGGLFYQRMTPQDLTRLDDWFRDCLGSLNGERHLRLGSIKKFVREDGDTTVNDYQKVWVVMFKTKGDNVLFHTAWAGHDAWVKLR